LILAPLVCISLWYAPTHEAPAAQHAIAIAAFMIVLFVTEPVDHATAGFAGLLLFWATSTAPVATVFSGFAVETPWFLLGAMIMGAMASTSGLAQRIAFAVTARTGSSYSRLLLGFIIVDFLLTFLVPSGIARVTILGAIAGGVVEAFGVAKKSNVSRGLFIIITYSATIFDKMVVAGAASILARGIIEDIGQVDVLYSHWFLAYLPCDIITIVSCWAVIRYLYPPEKEGIDDPSHLKRQLEQLGPWTQAEKRAAFYLTTAVVLWMTDFIHGIDPAVIGITVGLLAIMPGIGVLNVGDMTRLNFAALWFTAAAMSMGRVLQTTQGLQMLTDAVTSWMSPLITGAVSKTVVLYWTAFVYHFFLANETAMLSTSLPVVLQFAKDNGLDVLSTGMIWTFAAGGKIFVYQSAVLIVGYSFGHFEAKDMLKVGLALTIIESLILLLLVPIYWPLIGIGH
jgi:anion transporter